MTFPTITDLPDAPQRTQTPDAFATTADTFVAALPDLVTEVNTAGAYIDTKTISVGNAFQGTYSAGTTYTTGQSVLYSGLFYLSLVDSNTGNTPSSSPSQWVEIVGAPSGGAGGVNTFTASGSLTNGDLVSLNSDGTVSVTTGVGLDTPVNFDTSGTLATAVYDSLNDKVVIVYYVSGVGYAVVGTISGTSITFGTPVQYHTDVENVTATFDSNSNKVVVIYRDPSNSNYGTAKVGTVSGTSISFGSATVFNTGITYDTTATFDSNSNKVVVAYRDQGNSGYGTAIVGTVSGTSISFGSEVVFRSSTCLKVTSIFDSSNNKVVIGFRDFGVSDYGSAVVGTVSGTSISFGTVADFSPDTSGIDYLAMSFDSTANKVAFMYRRGDNQKRAKVGTVSGTSISFGSEYTISSDSLNWFSANYSSAANKTFLFVSNSTDTTAEMYIGTISGTDISFGDPVVIDTRTVSYTTVVSSGNNIVLAYEAGSSTGGLATVYNASNNFESWIGVATESVTSGTETDITTIGGINEGQTGLSTGLKYYLRGDATIATSGASNREIGRATSATTLYITQGSVSL